MLEKFRIKFTENGNRQLYHMTQALLTNLDIFAGVKLRFFTGKSYCLKPSVLSRLACRQQRLVLL